MHLVGIEAVILAKCMQDPEVKDEYALQIRQTTSALTYGLVILPKIKRLEFYRFVICQSYGIAPTYYSICCVVCNAFLFILLQSNCRHRRI